MFLSLISISTCMQDNNNNFMLLKVLKTRAGNDIFVERGMQTFNNEVKNKEIQTLPILKSVSRNFSLAIMLMLFRRD